MKMHPEMHDVRTGLCVHTLPGWRVVAAAVTAHNSTLAVTPRGSDTTHQKGQYSGQTDLKTCQVKGTSGGKGRAHCRSSQLPGKAPEVTKV